MVVKIYSILLVLFMVGFISPIYSGECMSTNLSELNSSNLVYLVIGNSSNIDGLTIQMNGTEVKICTEINYKQDNFTLIFLDNSTKEIIKEVQVQNSCGSCGGSRTIYKNKTEYTEVPNYISVPNKTIEYIENKKTEYIDKSDIPLWEKIFVLCLFVIMVIIGFKRQNSKKDRDERR